MLTSGSIFERSMDDINLMNILLECEDPPITHPEPEFKKGQNIPKPETFKQVLPAIRYIVTHRYERNMDYPDDYIFLNGGPPTPLNAWVSWASGNRLYIWGVRMDFDRMLHLMYTVSMVVIAICMMIITWEVLMHT